MYNEITYTTLKARSYPIPTQRFVRMRILSVSFLQDWDLVNSSNNRLAFSEGGPTIVAEVPVGTYSVSNFGPALAAAMSSVGTQEYTTSYSGVTRKLTIKTSGSKDFRILPQSDGTTSSILTGQSRSTPTASGKSVELKHPINLSGSFPLILTSNIPCGGTRFLSDFNDSAQSVWTTLTPDSFGDIVTWSNDSGDWLEVDENVNRVEFTLIDSLTGSEVALNSPLTVRFAYDDDDRAR